jgi:ubiquitin-protein ligase
MIGEEVTEDKLEGLISQVDKNNSRAIEFQEFLILLSEIRKGGGYVCYFCATDAYPPQRLYLLCSLPPLSFFPLSQSPFLRPPGSGALGNVMVQAKQGAGMAALLRDLEENPVRGCSVKARSKDMMKWKVLVKGPDKTPYAGGTFKLAVDLPDEFPYSPPDMVYTFPLATCVFCLLLTYGYVPRCVSFVLPPPPSSLSAAQYFVSRIYHVNVITLLNGRGSLQFILKDWDPGWDIRKALTQLVKMLASPDVEIVPQKYHPTPGQSSSTPTALDFAKFRGNQCDMLHAQCVWMYVNDRESFDKVAADFTRRFACLPDGVLQRSIK